MIQNNRIIGFVDHKMVFKYIVVQLEEFLSRSMIISKDIDMTFKEDKAIF